ncbi:MAG: NfeD family protein [Planctomycetales bacterium]
MESSTWAFLLLVIGLVLLIAEVFIPTGGIILILAILSLLGALIFAGKAWWGTQPAYFWGFLATMVVMLPAVVGTAFYIWPSTALGKRAILEAPAPHEVASFVEQEEKLGQLVGKVGETLTMLNPAGIARIEGERVHCQNEGGGILGAGVQVRVLSAQGNRLLVRQAEANDAKPSPGRPASPDAQRQPLDFELS